MQISGFLLIYFFWFEFCYELLLRQDWRKSEAIRMEFHNPLFDIESYLRRQLKKCHKTFVMFLKVFELPDLCGFDRVRFIHKRLTDFDEVCNLDWI